MRKRMLWMGLALLLGFFLAAMLVAIMRPVATESYIEEEEEKSIWPRFQFRLCEPTEAFPEPILISEFLSQEEVDVLIAASHAKGFHGSMVEDNKKNDVVRKSETCWLYPKDLETLERIYQRILQLPSLKEGSDNGDQYSLEPCQIVRYGLGGHYSSHYDQCYDKREYCIRQMRDYNGPRKWTLIMYLTDDYHGGETHFPKLRRHIKAKRGDALLFHSLSPDSTMVHPLSLHEGVPVVRGQKMIANVWIRIQNIQYE